jgi:drug/metabolite transporter (DMT)-like permease
MLAVIWGLSFAFIKIGDQALAPLQVTFGRMVVGAGTLLAVLAARRRLLRPGLGLHPPLPDRLGPLEPGTVGRAAPGWHGPARRDHPVVTTTPAHLPARVVLAVLALGALGTGIAYVLQYGLIRDAGATVAYLIPVVSTLVGVVVLGEQLIWNQPLGAAMILAGAALSQRHTPVTATPSTHLNPLEPAHHR